MTRTAKKLRLQLVLLLVLAVGAVVVYQLGSAMQAQKARERSQKLEKVHHTSLAEVQHNITNFATIVAALQTYLSHSDHVLSVQEMFDYTNEMLGEVGHSDSIVVSFIDTNHIFQYCYSRTTINNCGLVGSNVSELRTPEEIALLDSMMHGDYLLMFDPINLYEGWAGLPIDAGVHRGGKAVGYLAAIINIKSITAEALDDFKDEFVFKYAMASGTEFDREAVYDGAKIFNKKRDVQYYKNYALDESSLLESKLDVYGNSITFSTAYKQIDQGTNYFTLLLYGWYLMLMAFAVATVVQMYRYHRVNTELSAAKSAIESKNKVIEEALHANQFLMKEIHHRVKNNLQFLSSMLNLQIHSIKDSAAKAVLKESRSRIISMGLVHHKLYQTNNESRIDFDDFGRNLLSYISSMFAEEGKVINHTMESRGITLNLGTATPLGLILNELATNSFKHAFINRETGNIYVSLKKLDDNYYAFEYKDDGNGIPESLDKDDLDSLGLELIDSLCKQIDAFVRQEPGGNGVHYYIEFKETESNFTDFEDEVDTKPDAM